VRNPRTAAFGRSRSRRPLQRLDDRDHPPHAPRRPTTAPARGPGEPAARLGDVVDGDVAEARKEPEHRANRIIVGVHVVAVMSDDQPIPRNLGEDTAALRIVAHTRYPRSVAGMPQYELHPAHTAEPGARSTTGDHLAGGYALPSGVRQDVRDRHGNESRAGRGATFIGTSRRTPSPRPWGRASSKRDRAAVPGRPT